MNFFTKLGLLIDEQIAEVKEAIRQDRKNDIDSLFADSSRRVSALATNVEKYASQRVAGMRNHLRRDNEDCSRKMAEAIRRYDDALKAINRLGFEKK